jgi:aspartate-semialdehyde dehydrogenase
MSRKLGDLVVKECRPEEFVGESSVDMVFSGLDSDVAGETGMYFQCHGDCGRL